MSAQKKADISRPQRIKRFLGLEDASLSVFGVMWLLAPVAMWFSYRPLFRFGENSTMYFELSVTLVYLVVLAAAGLPEIWLGKAQLAKIRAVIVMTAFVALSGASVLWTPNKTRGLLTLGVIGLIYSIILASIAARKQIQKITHPLATALIASATLMSVLAVLQLVAAIWLSQDLTLLCDGCTPAQFGFARPNVFAIEPQFFGSMLLAPALVTSYLFIKRPNKALTTSLYIIVLGLFLTLSRGAVFAFVIGLIVILAFELRSFRRATQLLGIITVCFISVLLIQGGAAAANPNIERNFSDAITASISHFSLGIIDSSPNDKVAVTPRINQPDKEPNAEAKPNFDGYIEESTNVRLTLTGLALNAWSREPERVVFGAGLGGSGIVIKNEFPDQVNNREIVQNEYAELLLENGLVGLGLFAAVIGLLLYSLRQSKWTWGIVLAFLVQWNFFSGYPNALHIYLIFIAMYVVAGKPRHNSIMQGY